MKPTTQSRNHPQKGSVIIIEPLRSLEDVAKVEGVLAKHPRNLALFKLGVNSNLRASDLLALRCSDIDWKRGEIRLREKKTGKTRHIALSAGVLTRLVAIRGDDNDYLFRSSKGGGMITVSALNNMVKLWCFRAGIAGNFGSHTLRKSWSFLQYTVFKADLAIISQELNHANMRTTYRYLGIMPDDVKKLYMREI
jgi:integrase